MALAMSYPHEGLYLGAAILALEFHCQGPAPGWHTALLAFARAAEFQPVLVDTLTVSVVNSPVTRFPGTFAPFTTLETDRKYVLLAITTASIHYPSINCI